MMLPVATVLIASQPAQASPLAYEGFSMPLPAPFHGGAGFSGLSTTFVHASSIPAIGILAISRFVIDVTKA